MGGKVKKKNLILAGSWNKTSSNTSDNSGLGSKALFVWTGQVVEGQIPPIHDTPSVSPAFTQTHTLRRTHAHV